MPQFKVVEVRGSAGMSKFAVPDTWEPLGRLGSGAYATVAGFRAGQEGRYAVKKIERVFDHPVLALRTLREVKLLQHFRHPNILSLRRFYVDGADFKDTYLCLEMMDSDLHKLIYGSKGLNNYQIQCVMYQILRGLLCLRTAHVVHRDMKPGNVLVKADGSVKIADLGLARAIDAGDDDHDEAVLTEYVVTRYYRAPEVVLTATHYTYAVDMWSAGCILGEMLTCKPVFQGKDSLDQIKKIVGVIGSQSADEMSWIPKSSPSWKFVEKCNRSASDEAFQKLLKTPGLDTNATSLLRQTLRFDPSKRIPVDEALGHAYLESFQADTDADVVSAKEVPPMDWIFDKDLCFDDQGKPKLYDPRRFRQALLACCSRDFLEQVRRSPSRRGVSPRTRAAPSGRAVTPPRSTTPSRQAPAGHDAPVRRRW